MNTGELQQNVGRRVVIDGHADMTAIVTAYEVRRTSVIIEVSWIDHSDIKTAWLDTARVTFCEPRHELTVKGVAS